MNRVGVAELPLHGGKCPPWLFARMVRLGGAITDIIVREHSGDEFLRRLADPFFFQSLGCVLGFDFHSSGLTTTTMGALKEAISPEKIGIAICGGKGKASKNTPLEIEKIADTFSLSTQRIDELKYASRMAAKVDNACVQDGYQLYHHTFVLGENGNWAVVQQGMHNRMARRYHWLSQGVRSFVDEPHSGIIGQRTEEFALDMTARLSEETRKASVDIVRENPRTLLRQVREVGQRCLDEYFGKGSPVMKLVMQKPHHIMWLTKPTAEALKKAYELQPSCYEELVAIRGIGPTAVRALALVSELIYGKAPSWKDPVKFSFAHGGKDGIPYPVNRATYQKTIEILESSIEGAKIGNREKLNAIRRLRNFIQ